MADINPDLYLVANVMRVGKMLHSESVKKGDKSGTTPCYRRPYGVGVLSLASLMTGSVNPEGTLDTEEKEHSFKVNISKILLILTHIQTNSFFLTFNSYFNAKRKNSINCTR